MSSSSNSSSALPGDQDDGKFPGRVPWIVLGLNYLNSAMEVATVNALGGPGASWIASLHDGSVHLPHVVPGFSATAAGAVLSVNFEEVSERLSLAEPVRAAPRLQTHLSLSLSLSSQTVCPFTVPSGQGLYQAINTSVPEDTRVDPLGLEPGERILDFMTSFYRMAGLLNTCLRFCLPSLLREVPCKSAEAKEPVVSRDGNTTLFQVRHTFPVPSERSSRALLESSSADRRLSRFLHAGLLRPAVLQPEALP